MYWQTGLLIFSWLTDFVGTPLLGTINPLHEAVIQLLGLASPVYGKTQLSQVIVQQMLIVLV